MIRKEIDNLYFFSIGFESRELLLFPAKPWPRQVEGHRRPLAGPFHAHEGPYVPPAMLPGPLAIRLPA